MQVEEVVGKHLKQKVQFSVEFRSMMALGKWPGVFVCAKSNCILVLLIDVASHFKCLWKYPKTVLCGPLSNETHSRTALVAIRSLASTQCTLWIVVSEGTSTWRPRGRTSGFSSSTGTVDAMRPPILAHSWPVGPVGPAVLVLSASSSSGPSPPGHMSSHGGLQED